MNVRQLLIALVILDLASVNVAAGGGDDGTAGWQADRRLTFDPAASELSFNFKWSIAAGSRRSVHAIWHDTRDGVPQIYYKRSLDGGLTWGPDVRLSTAPGTREHAAIAASGGHVYVAWHDTREANLNIYLKHSSDYGFTWGPDIRLSASGTAAHPSVAASRDRVHVVWGDTRSGCAEIYTRRSTDGGTSWDAETLVSESPYESWVPTVAVSRKTVLVGWVDYRDANEEEYLRRSTDAGVTWGPVTRLTTNAADSWAPSLAIRGRRAHCVWFDRRDAGLSDTDVEAKLDEAMALLGLPPAPAPPRDPAVYYLPLFQQRLQSKMQAISAAAPAWVQAGNDPLVLQAILTEFQARMDAWARGWSIYYKGSTDGGLTWGGETRLSIANGPSMRPSIAASGRQLHVVWFDGRHGDNEVYYRLSNDRGRSWGAEVRLTIAPGDSLHPTVAADRASGTHVLWFDARDGNTEIYYKHKER